MDEKYKSYAGTAVLALFLMFFLWLVGALRLHDFLTIIVAFGFTWFALWLAYSTGSPDPKSKQSPK